MSGICGWFGPSRAGEATAILGGMTHVFARSADRPLRTVADERCALAASSVAGAADAVCVDGLYAAIDGRPQWPDSLAATAREHGDAAGLIAAYRRHGKGVVSLLGGSFAFVIVDPASNEALLAVDRLGQRPLAFAQTGAHLIFGSTLDAVRGHPVVDTHIDPQALFDLLYFSMIPSPRTLYTRVAKLEPGQLAHLANGRLQREHYWQPEFREQYDGSASQLGAQLREVLRQAVRRAAPAADAGLFLSGGLDSSSVCGIYRDLHPGAAHSFSIGFDAEGYDEMEYARIAARHFNLTPHEYYVTPDDVVAVLNIIADRYDEPFANSSAVPTYYCARLAREHGFNVMLAGDGGDELFAGNARYLKQQAFELYGTIPAVLRRFGLEPLLLRAPTWLRLRLLQKARSYVEQAMIPLPDRMETYNHLFRSGPAEIFAPDFLSQVDTGAPLAHLREVYARTQGASVLNRMLHLDWKLTLADNDLRKVNRMCEAAGVEVRYPMLDDAVTSFSMRVPTDLKIKRRTLRYFYKHAMTGLLPPAIITKTKHGFGLPFGQWLRTSPALQQTVSDALDGLTSRGYLRPDYIRNLLRAHRQEHAAFYGSMIWSLTVLELWLRAHATRTAAQTRPASEARF